MIGKERKLAGIVAGGADDFDDNFIQVIRGSRQNDFQSHTEFLGVGDFDATAADNDSSLNLGRLAQVWLKSQMQHVALLLHSKANLLQTRRGLGFASRVLFDFPDQKLGLGIVRQKPLQQINFVAVVFLCHLLLDLGRQRRQASLDVGGTDSIARGRLGFGFGFYGVRLHARFLAEFEFQSNADLGLDSGDGLRERKKATAGAVALI